MTTPSAQRADAMIAWFRTYAATRLNTHLGDERRTIPPYVILDLGQQGFFGLMAPEAQGGKALDHVDMARVFAQVGAVDLTLAMLLGIHNGLGLRAIQQHAQPELAALWLPVLASGRQLIAFALTEPGAGSNPQAIQATARRVAGGWRLDAHKQWIGLGSWAGLIIVVARAVDADGKALRQIALAVPAHTPGLTVGPEARTMGLKGFVQNELFIQDAFVPDAHVLGRPGAGMLVAQDAMMISRVGISAVCVGAMKRAAQQMARYAGRREVATGLLADNAIAYYSLNEAACAAEAAQALITHVMAGLDAGNPLSKAASLACKATIPELLWQVLDRQVQLLGGRGYIETNHAPRFLRDARVLRIFEGPTEPLLAALGAMTLTKGGAIESLISNDFQAPDFARAHAATCAQLIEHHATLEFATPEHHTQWTEQTLGRLTADALLHAASLIHATPDTATWTGHRYEATKATAINWQSPLPTHTALTSRIEAFAEAIGDVEETLAAESTTLDPFLTKHPQR